MMQVAETERELVSRLVSRKTEPLVIALLLDPMPYVMSACNAALCCLCMMLGAVCGAYTASRQCAICSMQGVDDDCCGAFCRKACSSVSRLRDRRWMLSAILITVRRQCRQQLCRRCLKPDTH